MRPVVDRGVLVVGHPRSGTGYLTAVLRAAGLLVGHEVPDRGGVVSWIYAFDGLVPPWFPDVPPRGSLKGWSPRIHLVRHPLKVIASTTTEAPASWKIRAAAIPQIKAAKNIVEAGAISWLGWNLVCQRVARKRRLRVEECRARWGTLKRWVGLKPGVPFPASVSRATNARPHESLGWDDLAQFCRKEVLVEVLRVAAFYGYEDAHPERPSEGVPQPC